MFVNLWDQLPKLNALTQTTAQNLKAVDDFTKTFKYCVSSFEHEMRQAALQLKRDFEGQKDSSASMVLQMAS
jgi:hypothetical protein